MNETVIGRPEWTAGDFLIDQRFGPPAAVHGEVKGAFGVRLECTREQQDDGSEIWTLTHLPTGGAIGVMFSSAENAKACAEEMIGLGDWGIITTLLDRDDAAAWPAWVLAGQATIQRWRDHENRLAGEGS